MVMPGTHSKWVQVRNGRITHFASYMTGEIFSVLVKHSILGRLMTDEATDDAGATEAAFMQGLKAARDSQPGDFTHQIFAARTLGLTQRLPQHLLKSYLSGLLIGNELVSGLAKSLTTLEAQGPLLLIGDLKLCQRYAQAFLALGVPVAGILDNPAPRGLWEFAKALGLLNKTINVLN
jgi:2-dehydro-3-deoxygalactonokinase